MSKDKTPFTFKVDLKALEKSNEKFHKLSKKKQRLAIAHDVVQQVKMKKFIASPGIYHRIGTDGPLSLDETSRLYSDMQKFLLESEKACNVCGLGAAFCSLARLGDETSWASRDRWALKPIFGYDQLALIEMAFEGWGFDRAEEEGLDVSKEEVARTRDFYRRRPDASKRLVAIFNNIIKNDGTFKP